jgi:hypothetical protein
LGKGWRNKHETLPKKNNDARNIARLTVNAIAKGLFSQKLANKLVARMLGRKEM